jgi:hypothetical protein
VNDRRSTRLAWSLWSFALVSMAAWMLLLVANQPVLAGIDRLPPEVALVVPGFATMGAVLAARRPHHPIGWLFLGVGLGAAVQACIFQYALRALGTAPGSLPWGGFVAWLSQPLQPLTYLAVALLLLLFPTGQLPSRRWRPLVWVLGVVAALLALGFALLPGSIQLAGGRQIPTAPAGWMPRWVISPYLLLPVWWLALVVAAAAPLVRLRRATGQERNQLKWLAYIAGLVAVIGLIAAGAVNQHPLIGNGLGVLAVAGLGIGLPVATGVAILKHGLYDIDRIINRTLVYGLLTILLGAVYAGLVLGLGQLFGRIGTKTPSWVVAGATLAVAGLFQPARGRIQAVVDRRFNRRKYDAAKTVEAFSTRLRDEIDLDALSAELLAVAHQTMQPSTASLWLRRSKAP